jgi:hypothetical protein
MKLGMCIRPPEPISAAHFTSSHTTDKGQSSSLLVRRGARNSSPYKKERKKGQFVTNCYRGPRTCEGSSERPKQWKMDMRFGT